MEAYIRVGLLCVAGLILFLMFREARLRKNKYRNIKVIGCNEFSEMKFNTMESNSSELVEKGVDAHLEPHLSTQSISINESENKKRLTYESDHLIISVIAAPNKNFESYELLQSISATGMQYGNNRLFHYYIPYQSKAISLFSLSSISEPGDFDLDRIGEFSCAGLMLFMDCRQVPHPQEAFELMLKTAEQLAEDLEGELRAGQRHAWNDTMLHLYRKKVKEYEQGVDV